MLSRQGYHRLPAYIINKFPVLELLLRIADNMVNRVWHSLYSPPGLTFGSLSQYFTSDLRTVFATLLASSLLNLRFKMVPCSARVHSELNHLPVLLFLRT